MLQQIRQSFFPKALIVSACFLLGACANKVTVQADIPPPLVEKVDLNVNLSFTEEFKNHLYEETEKGRSLSSLDLAQAQIDMFQAIFVRLTNLVERNDPNLDLILEPEILSFEYSAPRETSLKQYEVSIKYRLKILDSANNVVADWIIKGYGKTPTALLSSAVSAFNAASNIALRDIGAQLATRFARQKKIAVLINKEKEQEEIEDLGVSSKTEPELSTSNSTLITTQTAVATTEDSEVVASESNATIGGDDE